MVGLFTAGLGSLEARAGRGLDGVLETPDSIVVAGNVSDQVHQGVAHYHGPDLPDVQLEAEKLTLNTTWERGKLVDPDQTASRYKVVEEQGRKIERFERARLSLSPLQPMPQMLAFSEENETAIEYESEGATSAQTAPSTLLALAGWDGDAESRDYPHPFFQYRTSDSSIGVQSVDTVLVRGDFGLFVRNVTLVGESADESLHHWSGYRSNETAAGVEDYHQRVTVLRIENGTLRIGSEDSIGVFGSKLSPHVNGTVVTQGGTFGRLAHSEEIYAYDGESASITGQGRLTLRSSPASWMQTDDQHPSGPSLQLRLQGSFEPIAPPSVEVVDTGSSTMDTPLSSAIGASTMTVVAVAVPVLVATGGATYALTRGRTSARVTGERETNEDRGGAVDEIGADPARPVDESFDERMNRARELYQMQHLGEARQLARTIAEAYPNHPAPRCLLGEVLLEAGDPEHAEEAFRECEEVVDGSEPDALVGLVRSRAGMGDHEAAARTLGELSGISPRQAAFLCSQPSFAEATLACLDSLSVETLEVWARQLIEDGRLERLRELARTLADVRPEVLPRLVETQGGARLTRFALDDVPADLLRGLVEVAWSHDHLRLAADALVRLAKENPSEARVLLEEPVYRPLADDVRVDGVLSGDRHTQPPGRDRNQGV